MGAAAAEALDKTPQQLEVLAQAGVVDAGGRGLLVLLDSLTATVGGHRPERRTYEPGCRTAVLDAAPPQFEVMYLLGDVNRRRQQHCAHGSRSWATRL